MRFQQPNLKSLKCMGTGSAQCRILSFRKKMSKNLFRSPKRAFFDCKTRIYCLPEDENPELNLTKFDEFNNTIVLTECPGYLNGEGTDFL